MQNWCDENLFSPEEINYYDYRGFLWSTQQSVEEEIKKDIITKYRYDGKNIVDNGALDFELSADDEASIKEINRRPGLYAIYQNGGDGKLTAPSLVWTFDPKFKDTIRDKNQWEKEDEEQTLLGSVIGLLISTIVETHTSVETTKAAAKNGNLDKWNPYDDIEALLSKKDRDILQTLFLKYAGSSAQNIIYNLKTVSDDTLLRGKKLSVFLYSMYDEVQSAQTLSNPNDHSWEDVYARYLEKVVPHKLWGETIHEALYSEGNVPSRKKLILYLH